MTRRNFQNERYTNREEKDNRGVTKKSASKAKPAKEAASTVYVKGKAKKSRKELKAEASIQEQKRRERDERKRGANAGSESLEKTSERDIRIKKWRITWWSMIGVAVVMVAVSWFTKDMGQPLFITCIVIAYALIIGALYIEFGKIRKIRNEGQRSSERKVTKKTIRHEAEAARIEAERKAAKKAARKENGLFGLKGNKGEAAAPVGDLPFDESYDK